jgi:hypothetical protein
MRFHEEFSFKTWLYIAALICVTPFVFAQRPVPAPAQSKSILLTNAVIHIGNGDRIDVGYVGLRAGKISEVGDLQKLSTRLTEYDTVIDLQGKHIYPGLILMNTSLGLREIDAVRATLDYSETGELNPESRSIIAYNTDSKIIPTVRRNGVLTAQVAPRGGIIPGTSCVVQLDAWNWEDAAIVMEDGIHLNWPTRVVYSARRDDEGRHEKNIAAREEKIAAIRDLFTRARVFDPGLTGQPVNSRLQSMKGLFEGTKILYLHADAELDIMESILFAREMGVKRIVLVGGNELTSILQFLKSNPVPVILHRVHRLPDSEDEDIRRPLLWPKNYGMQASFLPSITVEAWKPWEAETCHSQPEP